MKDIREAEVFASSSDHLLCRLNYTSGIPCDGVEEPKSSESFGISIRAVFTGPDGPRIGFGGEARDLLPGGARRALEKARSNAVSDAELVSLPRPDASNMLRKRTPSGRSYDAAIMQLKDSALVDIGWRAIREALHTFEISAPLIELAGSKDKLSSLGLIVGGDVSVYRQRMALASTHQPKVQTDETTFLTSLVTSMVESRQAKGTGYEATTHLSKFKGAAGHEAATHAIASIGGRRLPSGIYPVILGAQPVSDLMTNLILPSLSAEAFYSSRSTFLGELYRPVAAPMLTIYDQGTGRGLVGSRRLTCEGLPTGRTTLIRNGVLQGLLSNYYETQRLLRDPQAREKLGANPHDHTDALTPRNGFRLSSRGSRQFDVPPSVAATNVFIEGSQRHTTESLLHLVQNGAYIGRIWYTYPLNGLRAGDFTCTVVGDSYLSGTVESLSRFKGIPCAVTGNIRQLLENILGVTLQTRPIVGWGSDEVVYAPEIAVRDVRLSEIAQFMQSGIK